MPENILPHSDNTAFAQGAAQAHGIDDRTSTLADPVRAALLASTAILVALVAQAYLNRRVFLSDAVYLFFCASALFVAAFPRGGAAARSSWLKAATQIFLLVVAVAIAAKVYSDLSNNRNYVYAIALAFVPPLLIGAAFGGSRRTSRPDSEPDALLNNLWQHMQPTATQVTIDRLCLVAGGLLSVVALAYWFKPGRSNEAIVVNILSIFLLFVAVYRLDRGRAIAAAPAVGAPRLPVELLIVIVIVAFAAFMRFWQLDTVPFGIWFDEGETGLEALRIFNGIAYTPIGTYSTANPSLFFYVIAFVYRFLGPTLLSVRLVQAVTGLLAVPALYVMLRYMFGWRTAVVGALMLAASAWHVDFSRFGMPYSIGAPLFEILLVFFLLWGLRSGRLVPFAWAGLMGGLGLHTYTGFRIFPIALIIYVVYGFILGKERIRQSILGLVVLGVLVIMTFAPLGTWAIQHWPEFSSRMGQTSVFAGKKTPQERMAALESSLRRHVPMINYHGDGNGRHNLPGAPAVDFVTGLAFLIGLAYCLYRWRSPAYLLLAAWLVVTMMAGVLSLDWEAPQQARTIVAVPAICAIAALTLGKLWEAWDRAANALRLALSRNLGSAAVTVIAVALLCFVGYVNYNRYFNQHMKNSEAFYSFSTIETMVARRVAALGPTTNRYLVQNLGTPAFTFLVGGDSPKRPVDAVFFQPYAHMPLRETATKNAVYLLEPWRVTIEPADVLRYYPNSVFIDQKDPFGKTMIYEFRVPADDINNLLGLSAHYYAGADAQGTLLLERVDKTITFDWRSQAPLQGDFNVEWTGSIVPPQAGVYTLDFSADGPVRMSLDGQWLDLGQGQTQVRVDLAKGLHPIVIQFRGKTINAQWTLPGGQRQPIPTTSLIALGLPEHGLVGSYYRGEAWQGRPEFVQVDPFMAFRWHPDPIEPVPWSAQWTGKIEIPATGKYLFQGVTNDRMWLIIDGTTYMDGIRSMKEVQIDLTAGRHDIQIKYANAKGYSEMRLMWRKPDGTFEAVPNKYLYVK